MRQVSAGIHKRKIKIMLINIPVGNIYVLVYFTWAYYSNIRVVSKSTFLSFGLYSLFSAKNVPSSHLCLWQFLVVTPINILISIFPNDY